MGGLAREFRKPTETMHRRARRVPPPAACRSTRGSGSTRHRARRTRPASRSRPRPSRASTGRTSGVVREGLMVERRQHGQRRRADRGRPPRPRPRRRALQDRPAVRTRSPRRSRADLERTRAAAPETHTEERRRVPFPSFEFRADGAAASDPPLSAVYDSGDPDELRAAALAAGATASRPAARRRGRRCGASAALATPEVAAACDLPGPRAAAELWRLASEWRVRAERVLSGELWQPA